MKKFLLTFLLFSLSLSTTAYANFSDNAFESFGFSGGSFSTNTNWNSGSSWIDMTSGTSGTYTSRVIDALASTSWSTFSWIPSRPYLKELPDSATSETAYSTGNANMTSNVLLMHMNETSGSLADNSGSSISGTVSGSPTYSSTGSLNTSLLFKGGGDYVTLTNSTNLFPTSNMTISAWVKKTGGNGNQRGIYSKMLYTSSTGKYKGFALLLDSNNKFSVLAANDSTIYAASKANTAIADSDSNWHHVVAVKTGGKFILYVDGAKQTESATSPITDSGAAPVIGRQLSNVANHYFVGNIDEVAVFTRAFTDGDVLDNYKRGAERLRFKVRSCSTADCSGREFIGPDGTSGSSFEEQDLNTSSLPSFNIGSIIENNRYFQYQATLETSNVLYSPDIKSVTVGSSSIGVLNSTFTPAYSSTDLTAESNLGAVSNLKLANSSGKITWANALDVRHQDLDSNVSIGSDYVSVNASTLPAAFDSDATVSINVSSCDSYQIYYDNVFRTNASDIITNGQICDENSTTACTNAMCSDGVLTFDVPHFDSYAVQEGGGGGGAPAGPTPTVPEFSTYALMAMLISSAWYMRRKFSLSN